MLEQSFSALAAHSDDAGGAVTIGGPAEFMAEIALPALASANDHGVTVHAHFGHTRGLIERLERAELDIVIATQRITSAAIAYERLFHEAFLLVAAPRQAHLLALPTGTCALAASLEAVPWVAYDAGLPLIRRFFRNALGRDPALLRVSTAPDLRAVLGLVQAGAGLSVLPDYLCAGALASGSIVEPWRPPKAAGNILWIASNKRGSNRRVRLVQSLLRRISGPRQDGEPLE